MKSSLFLCWSALSQGKARVAGDEVGKVGETRSAVALQTKIRSWDFLFSLLDLRHTNSVKELVFLQGGGAVVALVMATAT